MTREPRPTLVRCAGPCGRDVDPSEVREAQLSWCQPYKRSADPSHRTAGTHQDPQELYRTGVYLCRRCWTCKRGSIRSRFLVGFLDRVALALRQLAPVWVAPPAEVQTNVLNEEVTENVTAYPTERSKAAWRKALQQ